MDEDLPLGVDRVSRFVDGHRRAENLAETTDQFVLGVGFHVYDGSIVLGQWQALRRHHRQADDALLTLIHVGQDVFRQAKLPAGQVGDQPQSDGHGVIEGVAHGEGQRVWHARFQRFVHVYVSLAPLRSIPVHFQLDLEAHVAAHGWDPVHTFLDHAKGWKGDDPGTVDRREGDADAKVGPGELYPHRVRGGRRVA